MNAGSIVKEFDAAEATEDQLYQAMMSSQKELPQ
jgi:simple sugar transport system ATP-binding protein